MNFTVISLLSLLSFTSLVTSPAMSLDSDDEDTSSSHSSPIPSRRAASPSAEQEELDILLSKQNYSGAFASLRSTVAATYPDEEIVKFLLSSNGYLKYDTLSLTEKKWVATRIADKEVDIVDTTPKSSTPAAAVVSIPPASPPHSPRGSTASAAAAADPLDTTVLIPAKVAKAPLDAGVMVAIEGYVVGELEGLGNFTVTRKSRNGSATRTGPSKELAEHLNRIHGLLPLVITLDPTLTIDSLADAEAFVAPSSKISAFATADANKKRPLANKVNPSEFLLEVATLVRNIVEQNPGDAGAEAVHELFHDVLVDQGDCQAPALVGRLAYVYSVTFDYLVKKYNAGK